MAQVKWILFITKSTIITTEQIYAKWRESKWFGHGMALLKGMTLKYLIWNFHGNFCRPNFCTVCISFGLEWEINCIFCIQLWRGNLWANQMKNQHCAVPALDISFGCDGTGGKVKVLLMLLLLIVFKDYNKWLRVCVCAPAENGKMWNILHSTVNTSWDTVRGGKVK